ncbi:MAG: hypothetical protein J0H18_09765 [Rhizobiales bacterium]|nr:hypothetical protein [Hyphomicrobiales bacterium]OJX98735.1 MAG: hypothetical protein BGP07_13465 [Rhizobiales bacterium 63-22]
MTSNPTHENEESIDAFLMDPIVRMLMRADKVHEGELRTMLNEVADALLRQAELVRDPSSGETEPPAGAVPSPANCRN